MSITTQELERLRRIHGISRNCPAREPSNQHRRPGEITRQHTTYEWREVLRDVAQASGSPIGEGLKEMEKRASNLLQSK